MQEADLTLSTVHHAMSRSVFEDSKKPDPTIVVSARCPTEYATALKRICDSNGTTVAQFLNQCIKTLVDDYMGRTPQQD